MAQSDFWSEGRVLIAGDSRVRRLMSNPDPTLSRKVDFAFEGGVMIKDLVTLVDDNLNDHHKVVILMGMVGDEVQKYVHHLTADSSVNLLRSKECDASEQILNIVKISSAKWMSLRSDRIVLWSIPHYVDYVSYNAGKIGDYEAGESLRISLDSSQRFVNYVARLKLRWVADIPEVPFCLLNRVLFTGRKATEQFRSFGAVSAAEYEFPSHLMTDGLHPTVQFTGDIWRFLHKSVSDVHDKLTGRKKIVISPITSISSAAKKGDKGGSFKSQSSRSWKSQERNPYVPKKINLSKLQLPSVHSRLSQPQGNDETEDSLDAGSVGGYSNISWRASSHRQKEQGSPKIAPLGFIQQSQPWSWSIHNQRINAVKTEVYTQGLESQKRAEGRLADIIRDRGLKLAEQGQFDTVNAASRSWLTNLHEEMNSPAPGAKLVQKEIAKLLPVEEDKSSSSDTE